ncbi:hypothetical protein TI39_contig4106g00028 [Zymoseptoria brevis]|uniref:Uncharacterized protein n=1 Tax=Zymoseptoria brevis TaxID=1047168 RepID=A0A0F4GDP5_9PEZI|nr:hypothetical protein TI39_contig4106g00028 [Zymoseptoria brevis]
MLLLLLLFICPLASAEDSHWNEYDFDDIVPAPPPPVFGIDFTLDGVICSASLPNGSVVGLVASQGGHWYRETMRKTLDWAEDAALRETLPGWVHDPDYSDIHGDLKKVLNMTALANAVATAKYMALNVLELDHKVKITETRPQVVVSQPGFLFTDWPPPWTIDNNGHKKRIVKEPAAHWEAHTKMILQLSWAFCRAANLAHFRPYKVGENDDFDLPQYVCGRGMPVGAPTWAVCKASGGFCKTSYYSQDFYYENVIIPPNLYHRPNTTGAKPEEVVVVADMSSEGVLVWAEGIKRCQIQDRKWSLIRSPWIDKTWSYFPRSDHTGWVPAVRRGIEDVVRHARHRENATANVSIITNGGFWWEQARGALRDIAKGLEMNLTMLDTTSKGLGRWERDKTFDSSMAAAAGGMIQSMDPDVSDLSPLLDFVDFTGYGERGDNVMLHCREEVIAGETGPRNCDETDDDWWYGRDEL